ncbi:hypothetical protein RQP46_002059 [Phenoliferia psychrophenolica]
MSDFERERDRLISEIAEASPPLIAVNQLNRNIENVTTVGASFEPVHALWKQFENVMGTTSVQAEQDVHLQAPLPQGTDETAVLPAGIAPGGGEAIALLSESRNSA